MNTLTTEERQRISSHFQTHVDRSSRQAMIEFLSDHFRYDTMNSWNRSTSYAHCIKIHHDLGLPDNIKDVKWDMVFNNGWTDHLRDLLDQFDEHHDHNWQVGTNGRSGGYLVLYQGGTKNGKIVCYPGKSMDQNEDFQDWDMDQLRAKVDLVCDFDMLAADITIDFADFCRTYNVVEETVMVPKKVHVLKKKS
ncbi:MAG: hypothetical protein DRJ03_00025 [Chloroflexi bacterium]|nr:MAG: hypothetical protein DRJ03_00025 [Chloroflexota bacterium]